MKPSATGRAALGALALLALPSPASAAEAPSPRKVVVGTYLNHVYGIDMKNNQFSVDFYVWFRWEGDDLKPLDSFELSDGRITSKTGVTRKKIGGQSYTACRVLATVTKFWDLRRYPLDNHTLALEIEDTEHEDHDVVFEADVQNAGISPDLEVPGWVVKRTGSHVVQHTYKTNYGDTSVPTGNASTYSRYRFALDLGRPGYGRFVKVFFGLFVSTLISWCAFFIRPKDSSPRVSVGVGATFAAAAVTVAINNSLPDTNAVTMADKLIMVTLGIIFASLAATILALALNAKGREEAQRRLDRLFSWLFPLGYLTSIVLIAA